jgi:hypothetical protein
MLFIAKSVQNKPIMLSVIQLNVIMLSVVVLNVEAPFPGLGVAKNKKKFVDFSNGSR